jgi:hypothetical protein
MYKALGESRYNRTTLEYEHIAVSLPPLKQLDFLINKELKKLLASKGDQRLEFFRFKHDHERIVFEKYPDRISRETIRKALELHGFWVPRARRKLTQTRYRTAGGRE